jgi:hypothetical protein
MRFKRRLDALERLEAEVRVSPERTVRGVHVYCQNEAGEIVADAVTCLIDGCRAWVSVDEFFERYPDGDLIETYDPGAPR